MPGIPKDRSNHGSVPLWLCTLACTVSFLLGRNTSPRIIPYEATTTTTAANNNGNLSYSSTQEEAVKSLAPPCPKVATVECPVDLIFTNDWVQDPNEVLATINTMCNLIMKQRDYDYHNIGIGTITFCYSHVLTYKRNYNYAWDAVNNKTDKMPYYTGTDLPPYQMDMFQYLAIHSTIASIPSKSIRLQLEEKGSEFQDVTTNYQQDKKKSEGPKVLFWGCGADTPMHVNLLTFLGGSITFIDNSKQYMKICQEMYHDIRYIEPKGKTSDHTSSIAKLAKMDGSSLEMNDVNDTLTESQWMYNLSNIENEEWDVIVIDGPAQDLGRSQPLYMAKRLSQSYGSSLHTHILT